MNKSLTLQDLLIKHEGLKLKPYFDCCGKPFRECVCENQGKLTIGVGRNLEDVGISFNEAMILLEIDKNKAINAGNTFPWFTSLSTQRVNVIASMIFNMGLNRFCGFRRMIAAIKEGNFEKASKEMLDSKWAKQVKSRATELAEMMREG